MSTVDKLVGSLKFGVRSWGLGVGSGSLRSGLNNYNYTFNNWDLFRPTYRQAGIRAISLRFYSGPELVERE